ncbi:receptor homology region, transmembrane domain- and RING domain-containing protein 2-like [Cucurbita moschata]|uniref:Receptor homology region, transmembrane domain- and RING domain-containing protein 2-like n=1 Tax=Cucurbita moschata TaxID=3662 RepID=A0A6J1H371_CUCMO|nr:receptor homology region, transmembrane domain- and RING domain-containing protein 2-like [Cucurbita moschata]
MALSAANSGLAFLFLLLLVGCCGSAANVVLIGTNLTLSIDSIEADFAPTIASSGDPGVLYLANPLDACATLENKVQLPLTNSSPFALIIRGGCSFEDKVRRAQVAGFKAAIVYDNKDGGGLIAMAGSSAGIRIHAVFVTKSSGETLKKYAGSANVEIWIAPSFENSAWSIMAISFISLLAISAMLATCFFAHRHRIRRGHPRSSHAREFRGISRRVVKAMPSLIFTTALEDNCTSVTCAICLEDYTPGEKLRILQCHHKFHASCVDSWLTAWRTFCPVCKRDARTSTGDPPPSESTPLLSSISSSFASSSILSSARSLPPSSAIQVSLSSRSLSASRNHSLSTTPYLQHSVRSTFCPSPSQRSVELRNASSQRSYTSHLLSPYSSCYPSISPLHSRYMIPLIPSPSNTSPSIIGSSSHQHNPLHISGSAASFSPFASAQSLPEC